VKSVRDEAGAEAESGGRPVVLLTNDDGVLASGLEAMASALSKFARVVVLAPEKEQSACSHKLTLHAGLRLRRVRADWYALDGTPADCVYVGLFAEGRVLPRWPDLVVSGLNDGLNLGLDVYYSGTVAGAREAAMRGVPGLAVSADHAASRDDAAALCARIADVMIGMRGSWHSPPLLNVNIPAGEAWTVKVTRPGRRVYGEGVEFRKDPRGREYLWIGGAGVRNEGDDGTDTKAFVDGLVSVSSLPLRPCDCNGADPAEAVVEQLQSGKRS